MLQHSPLIERARERFRALKLRNVRVKYDDGNMGWADQGPFDGIIVTAAARNVPEALREQLLFLPVQQHRMGVE